MLTKRVARIFNWMTMAWWSSRSKSASGDTNASLPSVNPRFEVAIMAPFFVALTGWKSRLPPQQPLAGDRSRVQAVNAGAGVHATQ